MIVEALLFYFKNNAWDAKLNQNKQIKFDSHIPEMGPQGPEHHNCS